MITVPISIELKGLDTVHRNGNALTNEIRCMCKKSRAQKAIKQPLIATVLIIITISLFSRDTMDNMSSLR